MSVTTATDAPVRTVLEEDGAWLRLILDAPKGNVLDRRMLRALRAELARPGGAAGLRAISLEGAGPNFSYGASVAEHVPATMAELLHELHGVVRDLQALAVPTLAIVRGQCLGGACELVATCHFVFAAPDAKLGQPEIRLGVFAPLGSLVLPLRLGQAAADDLLLTGRSVDAGEALRMGLVTRVADDPLAEARAFVREHLAPRSSVALRYAVRAARDGFHRALGERLEALEHRYLHELMATADAGEGISAFVERRAPRWRHA